VEFNYKRLFLVMLLLLVAQLKVKAQTTDYKFQSMFIFNFTKYVDWPSNYKSGDFVIGVVGNKSVVNDLELMTKEKKVGNQKIVVARYSSLSDFSKCNVLFFTEGSLLSFASVLDKLKETPTLIITEKEGLLEKGSFINFISIGGKMKFELNTAGAEKAGLKIDRTLVGLAVKS
jgi:hypothetical protein